MTSEIRDKHGWCSGGMLHSASHNLNSMMLAMRLKDRARLGEAVLRSIKVALPGDLPLQEEIQDTGKPAPFFLSEAGGLGGC